MCVNAQEGRQQEVSHVGMEMGMVSQASHSKGGEWCGNWMPASCGNKNE